MYNEHQTRYSCMNKYENLRLFQLQEVCHNVLKNYIIQ